VTKEWIGKRGLLHEYLLSQGFVVATVDNRGSARRGKKFEAHLYRAFGTVEVEDQVSGVEHLVAQGFVDSGRVGFFGWSYGGFLAVNLALKAPDVYRAIVAVAPVADFALYDTHYTERYLGKPQTEPEAYQRTNTLALAARLKSKLMIIHGMADDNVLFTNSTQLFKSLQHAGKVYESVIYPGGKHGLYGKETQIHLYRTVTDFFARYLLSD
jgi:dipeptidyl-peptidase-4